MEMNRQMLAEKITGLAIATTGCFLWLLLFYTSLFHDGNCNILKASIWIFAGVISLTLIEVGFYWIQKSKTIKKASMNVTIDENTSANIAKWFAHLRVYTNILSYILLIFLLGLVTYLVVSYYHGKPMILCAQSYAQIILLTFYFFSRKKLQHTIKPWLVKFKNIFINFLPSYEFENNLIKIDLKITSTNDSKRKSIISINFNEIQELKILNYIEAKSLLDYKIGPDIQIGAASMKDMYKFLKGEIEKPNYYSKISSIGSTLYIKGQNLMYLITVSNTNTDELLKAFNKAKNL